MTLQQQAYKKIDSMSDDGIRFFLDFIDRISNLQVFSTDTGISHLDNENDDADSISQKNDGNAVSGDFLSYVGSLSSVEVASLTKAQKRKLFLQSGGRIDFDEDVYWKLRERSVL